MDFYCAEAKLVVELDGSQHVEATAEFDALRTRWLEADGLLVLRFWNNDLLSSPDGCLEEIIRAAKERSPNP